MYIWLILLNSSVSAVISYGLLSGVPFSAEARISVFTATFQIYSEAHERVPKIKLEL
jgi:hypothetical protein